MTHPTDHAVTVLAALSRLSCSSGRTLFDCCVPKRFLAVHNNCVYATNGARMIRITYSQRGDMPECARGKSSHILASHILDDDMRSDNSITVASIRKCIQGLESLCAKYMRVEHCGARANVTKLLEHIGPQGRRAHRYWDYVLLYARGIRLYAVRVNGNELSAPGLLCGARLLGPFATIQLHPVLRFARSIGVTTLYSTRRTKEHCHPAVFSGMGAGLRMDAIIMPLRCYSDEFHRVKGAVANGSDFEHG